MSTPLLPVAEHGRDVAPGLCWHVDDAQEAAEKAAREWDEAMWARLPSKTWLWIDPAAVTVRTGALHSRPFIC
ncbi:hypothetical protein [Nocardia transvalensis]|uniref:hypothetical protein n=1 Tax=Nocardia transvalensis TaxID=37333 RepID=UPI0018934994|nr:hypothetical protein [Nocardia transvalensis]MBF6333583.1 hypothetical protein [Nocardia transvalensis]